MAVVSLIIRQTFISPPSSIFGHKPMVPRLTRVMTSFFHNSLSFPALSGMPLSGMSWCMCFKMGDAQESLEEETSGGILQGPCESDSVHSLGTTVSVPSGADVLGLSCQQKVLG